MTLRLVAKRFGVFLIIVWLAATLNFFLPRLSGTDPVANKLLEQASLGGYAQAGIEDMVKVYQKQFGLDQPLLVQYWNYVRNVAHGDLNYSIANYPRSVVSMIAEALPWTIGLLGVTMSLILGVVLGGLSGFYGGVTDTVIQRVIEILRSIPTIPLWMGLAAALPRDWTILQVYFAITIIISLLGWTELARVIRGRFLALREEDFVVSARLVGCTKMRTIFVHMVPSFMSHIIAATTLAIPAIIISETSLSFLGLGLRPPAISWGVLLQDAQNIQALVLSPWLLIPAIPVIIAVLAFNFMGDGIRDAADPYL